MAEYLLDVAVLGLCDVLLAVLAWRLLARSTQRAPLARTAGAIVGGLAGAWLTEPQLGLVVERLGYWSEAAGLAFGFMYWFSLPVMTGMGAWLLAELAGGRSAKPWRAALFGCAGALVGTALLFVPIFVTPSALALNVSRDLGQLISLGLTSAGAAAGLALEKRREAKLRAGPARS